jgi:hypothetical protein
MLALQYHAFRAYVSEIPFGRRSDRAGGRDMNDPPDLICGFADRRQLPQLREATVSDSLKMGYQLAAAD